MLWCDIVLQATTTRVLIISRLGWAVLSGWSRKHDTITHTYKDFAGFCWQCVITATLSFLVATLIWNAAVASLIAHLQFSDTLWGATGSPVLKVLVLRPNKFPILLDMLVLQGVVAITKEHRTGQCSFHKGGVITIQLAWFYGCFHEAYYHAGRVRQAVHVWWWRQSTKWSRWW